MVGESLAKIMRLMPAQNKDECIKALILRRRLQSMYPELASEVEYADIFEGFDHSTGANLPDDNERINSKAAYLLKITQDRYRR